MKHKMIVLLTVIAFAASLSSGQQVAKVAPVPELLEQAIFTEETVGDLDAAMELYEQIVARTDADRSYGAQAQYRLALCLLKKGNSDDAVAALQKLAADFPKQELLVEQARVRLTELGYPGAEAGVTVRRVWAGRDVNLYGSPSPDGRFLTARHDSELAVHDLATGRTRHLTKRTDPVSNWGVSFSTVSPDGSRIAYSWWTRELTDLRVVGLDGSGERVLHAEEMTYANPAAWTADGKKILASWRRKDGDTVIALVGAADGSVKVLKTLDIGMPLGLSISPDGRFVVYDLASSEDPSRRDIFMLSTDGSREVPLVAHPASDFHPKWTPDGKGVLFLSDRGGSPGLWLVDVADGRPTGEPVLVKPDTGPIVPMGFTRNGAFYYGVESPKKNLFVATIDPASGRLTLPSAPAIDHFVGRNTAPSWSPDGRYLAYFSQRGSEHSEGTPWTLVIRSVAGGAEREIVLGMLLYDDPYRPRWSPDGSSVVVTAFFDEQGLQGFYRIDLQTEEVTPLVQVPVGEGIEELAWAPDGKTVYYDRHASDERTRCTLVARDLETGTVTELARADPPWGINYVALSPDGRTLAFLTTEEASLGEPFSSLIKVMPAGDGEQRELFRAKDQEFVSGGAGLVWTPDGEHLIFITGRPDRDERELWKISVREGAPVKLGNIPERPKHLSLHPDGRRLAYAAGQSEAEVWVMENFLPEPKGETVSEVRR